MGNAVITHGVDDSAVRAVVEDFRKQPRLLPLRCGVQHYDWGDTEAIPTLLGIENKKQEPYAELWIGAHPDLPSQAVIGETELTLDTLVDYLPEVLLCPEVSTRFERRLPFLIKVLSARKPLSIQAHPNQRQAREGFAWENDQGISLDDETRNYRDEHHKPELIAALTDFYALRGFRPLGEIATTLRYTGEFARFARLFQSTRVSLIDLYSTIMRLPQIEVDSILDPLVERLTAEHKIKPFDIEDVAYWVLEADRDYSKPPHRDRGIFSFYLLNLVHLLPGQAMYLPAGELHTYLKGTGVEIMANSNNVLRGGLTPKHVDIDELLKILTFNYGKPEVLQLHSENSATDFGVYETPVKEYELWRMCVDRGHSKEVRCRYSIQLAIVTEGNVSVVETNGTMSELTSGDAILIPCDLPCSFSSATGATVFLANVPRDRQSEPETLARQS